MDYGMGTVYLYVLVNNYGISTNGIPEKVVDLVMSSFELNNTCICFKTTCGDEMYTLYKKPETIIYDTIHDIYNVVLKHGLRLMNNSKGRIVLSKEYRFDLWRP